MRCTQSVAVYAHSNRTNMLGWCPAEVLKIWLLLWVRVAYLEYYIVPRTGVFTTYTRLNTGLRLQRRPELDGDVERELHQNRAQLNAHPVSSVE